jgi:hypothetical protein
MYSQYISGEQKLLAIAAHVTYFLGGLGFIIAPLVIYLFKKEDAFVRDVSIGIRLSLESVGERFAGVAPEDSHPPRPRAAVPRHQEVVLQD